MTTDPRRSRLFPQALFPQVLFLPALLLVTMLVAVPLAVAQSEAPAASPDQIAAQIATWNTRLEQIDLAIERTQTTDTDFKRYRDDAAKIATDATALATGLAPKAAIAQTQIDQLAPSPNTTVPESDSAKATREQAQAALAEVVGDQKQAQAVAAHANYTASQINDHRRAKFAATLLDRNASLIDPSLWRDALSEVPVQFSRTATLFTDWASVMLDSNDRLIVAGVIIVLFLVVVILPIFGRRYVMRRLQRLAVDGTPTSHTRLVSATMIVALSALLPLIFLSAGRAVLQSLDLMPFRIDIAWTGAMWATAFFFLALGLIRVFLAPSRPQWRLVPIEDGDASQLFVIAITIALLQAGVLLMETVAKINYASLSFVIAVQGSLSVAVAILIILGVRTLNRWSAVGEDDDEDEPSDGAQSLWRGAFGLVSIAAGAAIVADLIGYVALGRFITQQVTWASIVVGLLVLLMRAADEMTAASFRRDGVVGSRLIASIGIAPRSVTQLGVVLNGIIHLALITLAVLSIIAPLGVDSSSVFDTLTTLFFSFKIGSLTISIATIIAGIAVFAVGVVITRSVQKWLDTRFLPTTRLDSGLRNSIQTGIGYLGMIIAATVAFGYAGLDLSSIAIVAGALSVGIGLGLQAIVNNFVSGLILLVERPIRAGDWVTVGGEEGTVKRINVRATEIETFDRATLIVPNSTLITGPVKNMVLRDRSGRVVMPISVGKRADADRVKAILLAAAKAHPLVLRYPEAVVFFVNFGVNSLDFELRCYLGDISNGFAVRSDLRFEVLRELKAAEIDLPA